MKQASEINQSESSLRREIRNLKATMTQHAFGTPEHEAAKLKFWKAQGDLGKIELAKLGIKAQ